MPASQKPTDPEGDACGLVSNEAKPGTEAISLSGLPDHIKDAKGRLTPLSLVPVEELLQDDLVRRMHRRAEEIRQLLAAFRDEAFGEVEAFMQLLEQKLGSPQTSEKGNLTLTTYDGSLSMTVAVNEKLDFGPQLQVAQGMVMELLREWSADSRDEVRALIEGAFEVDQKGKINAGRILSLRRLQIADERWKKAMQAISDATKVVGSRQYVRFHTRDDKGEKRLIPLDLANA